MSTSAASPKKTAWFAILIVLVLHSAVLWGMGKWLWGREHYQFFPIVLIGSACLAWLRLEDAVWPSHPAFSVRVAIYGLISAALFALGAIADSNWLGTVAFIGMLWTAIWYVGGRGIAARMRGPVFVLLVALPLPLNLDMALIVELQKIASAAASSLLDNRQVIHTITGVAIRTVDKEFMVEEACSGIHSLFSCVTVMVFLATYFRYKPIRFVLTILQTIGWVVIGNILRVFLTIYSHSRWNMDLESGTAHDLLGVGTYLGALLMALSTDRMFQFLVPSHLKMFEKTDVLGGYGDGPGGYIQDSAAGVFKKFNRLMDKARLKPRPGVIAALVALGVLYLPFSGLTMANAFTRSSQTYTPGEFSESLDSFVAENLLPEQVGKWRLDSVRKVDRPMDDLLGANSVVWTYAGNGMTVEFSVDGLYKDWHDLSFCYSALGWKMQEVANIAIDSDDATTTRIDMYRDSGDYALSYFACFDSGFAPVKPAPSRGSAIRNLLLRLKSGSLVSEGSQSVQPPVIQFQLMTGSKRELLGHERDLLEELFSELSEQALSELKGGM